MKEKTIKFLAHYDQPALSHQARNVAPSAADKIRSVVQGLNELGYAVEIISFAGSCGRDITPAKVYPESENTRVRLFFSFGRGRKLLQILSYFLLRLQLLAYCLLHLHAGDTVFLYHAMEFIPIVRFLRRMKHFRLVLEMEELYADAANRPGWREKELRFAELADAYLFPTELLDAKINRAQKPSVILHGTCQPEEDRACSFEDGKIHVVYAGTLDPRKGGAAAAVKAAARLPDCYHIHILGFGDRQQIGQIQSLAAKITKAGKASVGYDGLLSGEAYIRFLQSCHIGLSTQNPDASFNDTSFPSKILSYMANGLRVVSVSIPAVECSAVSDLITYYHKQTPEAIAEAIMLVDREAPYDSRQRIRELHAAFVSDLGHMLDALNGAPLL